MIRRSSKKILLNFQCETIFVLFDLKIHHFFASLKNNDEEKNNKDHFSFEKRESF